MYKIFNKKEEIKMVDYENMSLSEVQRLARQSDKEALHEMRYRYPNNEEVPRKVWEAVWDEKAAKRGHTYSKRLYAGFLQAMPPSANFPKNRRAAMNLFESIVKDYNAGRLDEEDLSVGKVATIELGIMLCEGLGTKRDSKRGIKLIKDGEKDMQSFGGPKFNHLLSIGELYGMGYAQEDEEPSINDIEISIEYLKRALADFKSDRDDPRKLDSAKEYLNHHIKRLPEKKKYWEDRQASSGIAKQMYIDESKKYAEKRRKELSQPTEIGQQVEDFMRRLKERLIREGW